MINPIELNWELQEETEQPKVESKVDPEPEVEPPDEKRYVTIEIRDKGRLRGMHKLEYEPGKKLLTYLRQLNAASLLRRLRIMDMAHVELGRRRSSYVLQEDSHIVMLSSKTGLFPHLQRSGEDAERIARNMGGGAREVEVNINYRSDK